MEGKVGAEVAGEGIAIGISEGLLVGAAHCRSDRLPKRV